MELELFNFRSWEKAKFNFVDEGIALVSGASGSGKSTIFYAIHFALYGKGKKIITQGKKTCFVTLEWKGLKIYRSRSPNRLIVNDVYEGDVAQCIINETFNENFISKSFVQQKANKSFLNLSPSEKLLFLEEEAIPNNVPELKQKVHSFLKEKENECNELRGQIKMCEDVISSKTSNSKKKIQTKTRPSCLPIANNPKNQQKKSDNFIKNEYTHTKNCVTIKNKLARRKEKLLKELSTISENREKNKHKMSINRDIERMDQELHELEELLYLQQLHEIQELPEVEKRTHSMHSIDELVDILEEQLADHAENNLKYSQYKSRVEYHDRLTLQLTEVTEVTEVTDATDAAGKVNRSPGSRLSEYKKELQLATDRYTQQQYIDKIEKDIQDNQINPNDITGEINDLEQKISKAEDDVRELVGSLDSFKIKVCPGCNANLCTDSGKLVVYTGKISKVTEQIVNKEIALQKKNKIKLQKSLTKLTVKSEKWKSKTLELSKIRTRNDHSPSSLKQMKAAIQEIQEQINEINANDKTRNKLTNTLGKIDITEVQKPAEIDTESIRRRIVQIKTVKRDTRKLNITLKSKKVELSDIVTVYIIKTEEELDIKIEEISTLSAEKDLQHEKHLQNIEDVKCFLQYEKEQNEIKEWKCKFQKASDDLDRCNIECKASLDLKKLIIDAEAKSLSNYIHTVNLHVMHYLDLFFLSDPISVELMLYKESKKKVKKFQINIEVKYKGMDIDLTAISGGEFDRVQLAFALALSEIGNSKLVLLDESISSLDQQTCSTVLDGIRSSGRLTLIVSHQITSGEFDQIVKV
jgi:DNA repair exonuclease SbcCD ATPase subunit